MYLLGSFTLSAHLIHTEKDLKTFEKFETLLSDNMVQKENSKRNRNSDKQFMIFIHLISGFINPNTTSLSKSILIILTLFTTQYPTFNDPKESKRCQHCNRSTLINYNCLTLSQTSPGFYVSAVQVF